MAKRPHLTLQQKSDLLIAKAQGKPMILQEIADVLGLSYGRAQQIIPELRKSGLPVPEIRRVRHNGFNDNAKMPVHQRKAQTYYPSGLQVLSSRRDEETGKTIYLLR